MTTTQDSAPQAIWLSYDPQESAAAAQADADEAALAQLRTPVDELPDPLERPVVDVEAVRAELAAAEVALWWNSHRDRWERIPVGAAKQEEALRSYCEDQQDRYDRLWRSTPAYQRAVEQAMAKQREAADDRRYDRGRDADRERLRDKRTAELIEYGLSVHQARRQVEKEFGKDI